MTADVNRDNLIAAIDTLKLTPKAAAARLGVAVGVVNGICARKIWGQRIPEPPAFAAAEIIAEADERNGAAYAGAFEASEPIALLQDGGVGAPADEAALKAIEAAEANEAEERKALRKELLAECEKVESTDQPAADAIVKRAIRAGIDERNGAQQIQATLRPKLKLTMAQMKAHWARCEEEVKRDDYVPPSEEELAAHAAAEARAQAEADAARKAERDALYQRIRHIAEDPKLIERFIELVQRARVVNERRGIVAVKLTVASRLLANPANLLLKGPAASGKNTLIEKVLMFSREEADYITLNAASAKALVYMEEPLSHKMFYVPEAAALAQRASGDEDPFAAMLRTLLSEGRYVYYVTELIEDEEGRRRHVTRKIEKPGPVALGMTTARENVEEELGTRVLTAHMNESVRQTGAVIAAASRRDMGLSAAPTEAEIELWRTFEDYLRSGAPYHVVVPFADVVASGAILTAIRMRRDFPSIMALTKASAVLHKAQRETDAEGRIIATTEDYGWAEFAVLEGISATHAGTEVDTHTIAVGVYWLVEQAKREWRRNQMAKLLAQGLANDPACQAAKRALLQVHNAKSPSLEAIRQALTGAGLAPARPVWKSCIRAARRRFQAEPQTGCPASCRISVARLAVKLGLTPKVARTRLYRALADEVVIDLAAESRGSRSTAAHDLKPSAFFSISKITVSLKQALPSHEAVEAVIAGRKK